jgi:hypothetical protein
MNNELPTFLFGFNKKAEILNGRIAMISFIILFLIELVLHKPILFL